MIRVLVEHAAQLTIDTGIVLPMQHTAPFSHTVVPLVNVITCQKMAVLVVNSSPLLIRAICIMEILRVGVRMTQLILLVLARRTMPRRLMTSFTTLPLKLRQRPVQRIHPHYLNQLLRQQLLCQPVLQQQRHQLLVH